jgi:hypothetical protein
MLTLTIVLAGLALLCAILNKPNIGVALLAILALAHVLPK